LLSAKAERLAIILIIAILLLLSIYSWFPNPEPKDYVRTTFGLVLYWFLFDGRAWARWVVGILSAGAGLFGFYALFWMPAPDEARFLFLLLALVYTFIAFILLSPVFITEYFRRR
jgi:hypothetical protein